MAIEVMSKTILIGVERLFREGYKESDIKKILRYSPKLNLSEFQVEKYIGMAKSRSLGEMRPNYKESLTQSEEYKKWEGFQCWKEKEGK